MPSMGNVSIGLGQENDIIRLFQEGLWWQFEGSFVELNN